MKSAHDTHIPTTSIFHEQRYLFFKMYRPLVFMYPTFRGDCFIYLTNTGFLLVINTVFDLIGSFLLWIWSHFCVCFNNRYFFDRIFVSWFWGYIFWCILSVDLVVINNCYQYMKIPNIYQYYYHARSKMITEYFTCTMHV